jgi:hypothetical protein
MLERIASQVVTSLWTLSALLLLCLAIILWRRPRWASLWYDRMVWRHAARRTKKWFREQLKAELVGMGAIFLVTFVSTQGSPVERIVAGILSALGLFLLAGLLMLLWHSAMAPAEIYAHRNSRRRQLHSYVKTARVRERLAVEALELRAVPKLSIVFDPDNIPYLQHFPYNNTAEAFSGQIRMYRIGIQNDGVETIKDARVLLESFAFLMDGVECPPSTEHSLPVEHALNVMGHDTKDGTFDLRPGDRPTAHIDLLEQPIAADGNPLNLFSPCYASRHRVPLYLTVPSWVISVRAEGGNTFARRRFFVSKDGSGRVVVSPYPEHS